MQPLSGVHAELMGSVLSLFPTSPGDDETADAVELRSRLRRRLLIVAALLYSIWYVYTLRAKQSGRRWGHRLAAHFAAACCHATAVLFGLKLQVKYDGDMGGLKEEHKGLVAAVGPHGVFPLAMLGMGAFKFRPDTPYAENGLKDLNARFAGASILFCVPILRELLLLMGVREVSRPTVRRLLATDHTIAIQPGGIWEMVMCSSTQEALYFQVANQPTPSAQASTCARARRRRRPSAETSSVAYCSLRRGVFTPFGGRFPRRNLSGSCAWRWSSAGRCCHAIPLGRIK